MAFRDVIHRFFGMAELEINLFRAEVSVENSLESDISRKTLNIMYDEWDVIQESFASPSNSGFKLQLMFKVQDEDIPPFEPDTHPPWFNRQAAEPGIPTHPISRSVVLPRILVHLGPLASIE